MSRHSSFVISNKSQRISLTNSPRGHISRQTSPLSSNLSHKSGETSSSNSSSMASKEINKPINIASPISLSYENSFVTSKPAGRMSLPYVATKRTLSKQLDFKSTTRPINPNNSMNPSKMLPKTNGSNQNTPLNRRTSKGNIQAPLAGFGRTNTQTSA